MLFVRLCVLTMLVVCGPVVNAQSWDSDSNTPPPPSGGNARPAPVQAIEPFRLLVYDQCEPDHWGTVGFTGSLTIQFLTRYRSVGVIPYSTDSTLTLKLKTKNRGEKDAPFSIPTQSFQLSVVLGADTARLWVDRTTQPVRVEYQDTSNLLLLEPIKKLDPDIVSMQFMDGSTQKSVRSFVEDLCDQFGESVEIVQLESGYYPCLSAPDIERASIGRRNKKLSINQSQLGYVVCVRMSADANASALSEWIVTRQGVELDRYRGKRG